MFQDRENMRQCKGLHRSIVFVFQDDAIKNGWWLMCVCANVSAIEWKS